MPSIRSALSNDTYLTFSRFAIPPYLPIVGKEPRHAAPPDWDIFPVGGKGSNLYNISLGNHPIFVAGNGLRVYFAPSRLRHNAPPFSIESAGLVGFRFQVPNVTKGVWTLADNGTDNSLFGTPITLEEDKGLPGQRWSLGSLD